MRTERNKNRVFSSKHEDTMLLQETTNSEEGSVDKFSVTSHKIVVKKFKRAARVMDPKLQVVELNTLMKDQEDKQILKDWSIHEVKNTDNEFEEYDKELEY
jgi:hypothetical protein